jgi:hypothetical protein
VDVCTYIGVLETTSSSAPFQDSDLRRELPCAMKMSSEWINLEEENAAVLAAVEPLWERENILQERAAVLKEEAGRDEMDTSQLETQWEREDLLSSLDEAQLKAISSIISTAAGEKSSATHARKRNRTSSGGEVATASPTLSKTTPPRSRSLTPHASEPDEDDPSALSPASRRRYLKRLYMRRKRAEKTGNIVFEGVARLKTGKKRKQEQRNRGEEGRTTTCFPRKRCRTMQNVDGGAMASSGDEGSESEKEKGNLSDNLVDVPPKRYGP